MLSLLWPVVPAFEQGLPSKPRRSLSRTDHQENVGRQGQSGDGAAGEGSAGGGWAGGGVAHGIDIITAADYFSLGNRQQAYLEISKTVASFDRWGRMVAFRGRGVQGIEGGDAGLQPGYLLRVEHAVDTHPLARGFLFRRPLHTCSHRRFRHERLKRWSFRWSFLVRRTAFAA